MSAWGRNLHCMAFSGLAMKNKARMQYWNEHSALRRWEFQMLCHLCILTFQWCSLNPLISLTFLSASVNQGIWAKVTLSSLLTITNRFQGIYSLYIHYINRFFFSACGDQVFNLQSNFSTVLSIIMWNMLRECK